MVRISTITPEQQEVQVFFKVKEDWKQRGHAPCSKVRHQLCPMGCSKGQNRCKEGEAGMEPYNTRLYFIHGADRAQSRWSLTLMNDQKGSPRMSQSRRVQNAFRDHVSRRAPDGVIGSLFSPSESKSIKKLTLERMVSKETNRIKWLTVWE